MRQVIVVILIAGSWAARRGPPIRSITTGTSGRFSASGASRATAPRSGGRVCGWMGCPFCTREGIAGRRSAPATASESLLVQAIAGRRPGRADHASQGRPADARGGFPDSRLDRPGHSRSDRGDRGSDRKRQPSDHWAFRPVVRPPLPPVRDMSWVRNPIDRFILARLERHGIRPAPEADRATLLRRLSLDLTGLPPTLAEVDGFLADERPGALRAVRRAAPGLAQLMASDGARHWLDAASYADSGGSESDYPRSMWKYREWVIDALNRDLPFDRFVVEQLAGDLLPGATVEQKIATGFLCTAMSDGVARRMNTSGSRWPSIGST